MNHRLNGQHTARSRSIESPAIDLTEILEKEYYYSFRNLRMKPMEFHDKMLSFPFNMIRCDLLIGIFSVIMAFRVLSNHLSHEVYSCNGSIVTKVALISIDDIRPLLPERIENGKMGNITEEVVDSGKFIEEYSG